jgi:hypothetical protein
MCQCMGVKLTLHWPGPRPQKTIYIYVYIYIYKIVIFIYYKYFWGLGETNSIHFKMTKTRSQLFRNVNGPTFIQCLDRVQPTNNSQNES